MNRKALLFSLALMSAGAATVYQSLLTPTASVATLTQIKSEISGIKITDQTLEIRVKKNAEVYSVLPKNFDLLKLEKFKKENIVSTPIMLEVFETHSSEQTQWSIYNISTPSGTYLNKAKVQDREISFVLLTSLLGIAMLISGIHFLSRQLQNFSIAETRSQSKPRFAFKFPFLKKQSALN